MYARTLVALIVILSIVPGAAAGAVSGKPVLSASVADGTVTPGETTSLRLTIVNTGKVDQAGPESAGLTQRVTTARGLTAEVTAGDAPIDVLTGERAIGTLPEGSSPPLEIPIAVDEDAEPGTYEVPVEVNYTYTEQITDRGVYEEINASKELNVTIEVEAGARFSVADVDTGARVGATDTMSLTLRNTGSAAATEATVALQSRNADLTFGQGASASRHVGEWAPGENRTLEYEVTAAPTAKAQDYAMQATVEYQDRNGVPATSEPLSFAVQPQRQQRFGVASSESNVSIGDTGSVTVTMSNDGPVPVADATVTLRSTSGALVFGQSSSATRYVGAWNRGENRELTFDVTATEEAETRSYALRATVAYEDPDGDPGESPSVAVAVRPGAKQGFEFGDVAADLEVGSQGTLNGTVTNTGDAAVRNLVVTFAEEPGTVTPLETEAPVGDLGPGESTRFSFPIEVGSGAKAGPRQFTLRAVYRNGDGDRRQSDTADVSATVANDTPVFAVSADDPVVSPGEGTTINVTITNRGDETVTDVSAKLFANDPLSTSDSEAFVQGLEPGDSETVSFGVGAAGSALTKTYPVEMDFQYDDADGDTLTSQTYRLPVSVRPSDDDGGGLPLPVLVVGALVAVVAVGWAVRRYA
jgi:hypothetical protein